MRGGGLKGLMQGGGAVVPAILCGDVGGHEAVACTCDPRHLDRRGLILQNAARRSIGAGVRAVGHQHAVCPAIQQGLCGACGRGKRGLAQGACFLQIEIECGARVAEQRGQTVRLGGGGGGDAQVGAGEKGGARDLRQQGLCQVAIERGGAGPRFLRRAKAAICERAQDFVAGFFEGSGVGDGGDQAICGFDGHVAVGGLGGAVDVGRDEVQFRAGFDQGAAFGIGSDGAEQGGFEAMAGQRDGDVEGDPAGGAGDVAGFVIADLQGRGGAADDIPVGGTDAEDVGLCHAV